MDAEVSLPIDRGKHWLEAQESQGLASSISKADGGGKTDKKSC